MSNEIQTTDGKKGHGPAEVITRTEIGEWLGLIGDGLSDEMAAACVFRSPRGLKDHCNRHPDLALALGEAKAKKVLQHLSNLDRISKTDDVRGFNAAVRASENILQANDPRFRKDPDAAGPGSGVTIIVNSQISAPSGARFIEGGGMIDAESVRVLTGRGVEDGVKAVTEPGGAVRDSGGGIERLIQCRTDSPRDGDGVDTGAAGRDNGDGVDAATMEEGLF